MPTQRIETSSAPSRAREAVLTLGAAGVVVLFCGLLLAWDPGFFWIDDNQSGALPAYCEMARAWRAGEVPLLSRSSWRAGALGAEFPAGVFSPTLALSCLLAFGPDLPLPLAAAVLSIIHLAILAAGAFRLARQRGLAPDLALLVALVASLNGWILLWGARTWTVCLFSFAWLPWFWWALEYVRQPGRGWIRFVPAGLFLYLLITAGWPLTILMAALLSAWIMVRTWVEQSRLLAAWPTAAAWAVGLGLSAPAWLMFLEALPHAFRTQEVAGLGASYNWSVPSSSLWGLVLPNVVAPWWVFGILKPHVSAELAGGLVPVVILIGCLWYGGRACFKPLRWEWALGGLLLLLLLAPSVRSFQYSFRWLPFFFLVLGLLAGQSLNWVRSNTQRLPGPATGTAISGGRRKLPNLGRIAFVLVLFAWLPALLRQPEQLKYLLAAGGSLLFLAFLWWQVEAGWRPHFWLRRVMPAAAVFLSCWIACWSCAPFAEVPTWPFSERIRQAGPLDPAVRYLSVHYYFDIFDVDETRARQRWKGIGTELYLGNTAAYAGLDFVNGYSAIMPLGMNQLFPWEVHGSFFNPADAERVLGTETGPDGLLQLMGVDGLVVSDRFKKYRAVLLEKGWREVARMKGGRVFHRINSPSPRVRAVEQADLIADRAEAARRLTTHGRKPVPSVLLSENPSGRPRTLRFAPAKVSLVEERRLSMVADIAGTPGEGEILVVFARPWFPGYQAVCDGRPVPVEVFDLILPAVRLPAGTRGRVTLEYRPNSLVLGCRLAGLTALGVLLALLLAAGQRILRKRGRMALPAPGIEAAPRPTLSRDKEYSSHA